MEQKASKCPPTVESNQFSCVWSFNGMFDHHHDRPRRKLLSDVSHESKSLSGSGDAKSQVRMLTFDEQLRNINIESKKKAERVSPSIKRSSSNHTRKNDEILKNNLKIPFWKRIISHHENPNKKNKDPNFIDRIVVLKPIQRVIESPVDIGCRCSYSQPQNSSKSRQSIVKHTQVSFNDLRKKLKTAKKPKSNQKMKSFESFDIDGHTSKLEKLSLVPISKAREPEVFMEAKRHISERLRQIEIGDAEAPESSSKRPSRTLERILFSSMATVDCKLENIDTDRENPSPVSVLDPFFADNIGSPTSTVESVELQIQPRRLDFEERSSQTSSPPNHKIDLRISSSMEDQGFICSYINTIYRTSQSNWEEFLATDYQSEWSCDHKLLHDCVKEVLIGLDSQITFVSSKIRAFSLEKDVIDEVIEQVNWHTGRPVVPRTLDTLVRRDIEKLGQWVDISDRNEIVFEAIDEALNVLIMEAIIDIGL